MEISEKEAGLLLDWAYGIEAAYSSLGSKKDIQLVLRLYAEYPNLKIKKNWLWESLKDEYGIKRNING